MINEELTIEVEPRCISIWKKPWARRPARVTLLLDFDGRIVVVMDTSNGYWFLPGGGVEQGELVEQAAKREAEEELGLEIKVAQVVASFHVILVSTTKKEQVKAPPYIVVLAKSIGGKLRSEYAPNRKILLIDREKCKKLLQSLDIPSKYECFKPHHHISKEAIRRFIITNRRLSTCS